MVTLKSAMIAQKRVSFSHTNDTTFWCQDDTPVFTVHSRQLLKMLRRDTVVGGVAIASTNVLPHPLLSLRILLCTLKNPTLLHLAIDAAF